MCEINPKHKLFFKIEAFTSDPDMSEEDFKSTVLDRLFRMEMKLNEPGDLRFHVHQLEEKNK